MEELERVQRMTYRRMEQVDSELERFEERPKLTLSAIRFIALMSGELGWQRREANAFAAPNQRPRLYRFDIFALTLPIRFARRIIATLKVLGLIPKRDPIDPSPMRSIRMPAG